MPSLQANHSRACALGRAWTPFDQTTTGCTCPEGPLYYVIVREGEHAHKEVVGRDRNHAELALYRLSDAVAEGRFRPRPSIGFVEWADRWLASLERKPSTIGSYRSTIAHAKETFGTQRVRRICAEDIARFNQELRDRGCSASTRASTYVCWARAFRRLSSTGTPTQTLFVSCRRRSGLGRSARRLRTSRTMNCHGSLPT
jgi:hypothetical protein